ncbi:MAG: LPS assembly protein LptD [Pseudomonadota bacterium]|nr:LPS assembly protein LptD [Pseudomonadota bacterium]
MIKRISNRSIALILLVVSSGATHGEVQIAATTDWVGDTSGAYLCRGYYSPALVERSTGEQLSAEAENTDYDGSDRVVLSGRAVITRNDFQIEADRVSFLNSTGDGDAAGNVKIRRPNSLLIGDTASVNVRTNAFDLKNSSFVNHKNHLRGDSDFAIGAPNGDIRVFNGTITFCAPGINSWDFQANQIYLNQSSGRGWANDVVIRVKEIPIFYSPVVGFPMDDRRLTGFFFPSYSLGSTSGTEIVTPFYWNLAPHYDLLIRPRFMTARGTAVGLHGRYLFEDFSLLEAKTEQLPSDKISDSDRHISKLMLTSDVSKAVIWNMTYEDASDGTYQDDLDNFADLSEEQQLTSIIGATVRGNEWNAGWLVDRIDVVDPAVTGAAVKFSRQPQLTLSWAKYGEDWNLFALGDATEFTRTTTGLTSSDPSEGSRVSSDFKAEYPIQRGFGSLTPAALGFARWSQATIGATTQEDEYLAYGVSIDGRLHFENSRSNGSLHEMIPRVKLSVRELNKNPAIVKFDTPDTANDIDKVSQIFLDNPVSGGDFVGDTRDVALSLTARGINVNGLEKYRVSAGQTIYFQNRGVTLSGDPENADRGPLVIESAAQLGKSFNWNTRFRSVTDGETMDTATNEFKYQTSDTDYVTQRIVWENDAVTRADHYISSQVNPNWRFLGGLQWESDIQERVNQVVGIEYEGCCWRAAMIHANERDKVTETNGGHSMKLQVELKGLGVLGQGTSSILERLREGYELFESQD